MEGRNCAGYTWVSVFRMLSSGLLMENGILAYWTIGSAVSSMYSDNNIRISFSILKLFYRIFLKLDQAN